MIQEDEIIQRAKRLIKRYDDMRIVGGGGEWSGSARQGFAFNPKPIGGGGIGGGPPQPTGACCPEEGDCFISTQEVCEGGGGTYQGDGTDCDPDPCPPPTPTGACCVGTDCTIETEDDCTGMGGTYQGDGTTCDPNPCEMVDCICGFDGFLGMGTKYLTRTTTFTYSDNTPGPPEGIECNSSWTYITVDTYDPNTCVLTESCSGGGSGHFPDGSGGHSDYSWNWILTILGTCGCGPTTPEGFVCNSCDQTQGNLCSECNADTVISDTEMTGTCSYSNPDPPFTTSNNTCTVVLSDQCNPV